MIWELFFSVYFGFFLLLKSYVFINNSITILAIVVLFWSLSIYIHPLYLNLSIDYSQLIVRKFYFRPANFTFDPQIRFAGNICNFCPDFWGRKVVECGIKSIFSPLQPIFVKLFSYCQIYIFYGFLACLEWYKITFKD